MLLVTLTEEQLYALMCFVFVYVMAQVSHPVMTHANHMFLVIALMINGMTYCLQTIYK